MTHTAEEAKLRTLFEESVRRFLAGDDDSEEEEEEQKPMKKEALVSHPITSIGFNRPTTPEKRALINMQAEGLACIQSIVHESRRLQQWPEEVSRFQQFCMELHKPIETGFAMLACMMKYSPRAWHQSSRHRRGLESLAEEHKNSFLEYTSNIISDETELWAWHCLLYTSPSPRD